MPTDASREGNDLGRELDEAQQAVRITDEVRQEGSDLARTSEDASQARTVHITLHRGVDLPATSSASGELFRVYFAIANGGTKESDAVTRALPHNGIGAWNESVTLASLGKKDERLHVVLVDQSRKEGVDSLDMPSSELRCGNFVWCLNNGARLLGACEWANRHGAVKVDDPYISAIMPTREHLFTSASSSELAMHWTVALDGLTEALPGRRSTFRVVARDGSEAFRATGLNFDVMVYDSSDFLRGTVVDLKDGSYRVHFCALRPAHSYAVSVLLGDKDIFGSPVLLKGPILPPSAPVSTASGDGLHTAVCDSLSMFTLHLLNAKGQPADQHKQLAIIIDALLIDHSARLPAAVIRVAEGVFKVSYTVPAALLRYQLQISVLVAGSHIRGSPFSVGLREAPTSPEHCTVAGDGLYVARPGVDTTFSIASYDGTGRRRSTGGDKFSVKVASATQVVEGDVHDQGDGTYTVSYHLAEPDTYKITVILFKTQIFHGALDMGPGLPSAGKSVVLFKGSPAGLTGRRCMFTVLLRDKWGSDVPCSLLDIRVRCVAAADPAAQNAEQLEVTKSQKNLAATASSTDRLCHEVWALTSLRPRP